MTFGIDSAYIAVVGAGEGDPTAEAEAEIVGAELARRGAVVVCGGMTGVMASACRGAKQHDGLTIGILPTSDRRLGNDHLDVAIATGMGEMRNALVVRSADAVIAVGGEFGTLSEIAFALRIGKPVIGLGTWELSRRGRLSDAVRVASSPEKAVEMALVSVGQA